MLDYIAEYLPHLTAVALLDAVVTAVVIPIVLIKKRDPTVAAAWCLLVLLVPLLGALLFWGFGYNYIHRRISRLRKHRTAFYSSHPPARPEAARGRGRRRAPATGRLRSRTRPGHPGSASRRAR